MAISAKDVGELRKATGAGMMDCKKALEESGGDVDGAMDYLRKKDAARYKDLIGRLGLRR